MLCERRDSESLSDFLYTLLCYCVGGSTVRRLLGADPTEKVCLGGAFVPEVGGRFCIIGPLLSGSNLFEKTA